MPAVVRNRSKLSACPSIALATHAGLVFATRERPVAGARGDYRVIMRHGVSTVTSGARMTLGIIFHDAR